MRLISPTAAIAAVLALTACAARPTTSSLALSPPTTAASPYQLGIDLDFYWHSDQDVISLVTADAAYARDLGANSILISFPFYTDGVTAATGAATPPLGSCGRPSLPRNPKD